MHLTNKVLYDFFYILRSPHRKRKGGKGYSVIGDGLFTLFQATVKTSVTEKKFKYQ